ncbi:Aste57867_1153 [Aphanomyces stellatus]|uniref:Aste57867_1153 protein n=1 Tax=Aphanomyces stellatus TaxID=120398 RepID=A0A485K4I0_9STRA|nr:hypothetical protein As57867_001152 [Aphanomyces stellatus]VFT78373.1 Aste57867_1153 [Aphanomyces stellatus]
MSARVRLSIDLLATTSSPWPIIWRDPRKIQMHDGVRERKCNDHMHTSTLLSGCSVAESWGGGLTQAFLNLSLEAAALLPRLSARRRRQSVVHGAVGRAHETPKRLGYYFQRPDLDNGPSSPCRRRTMDDPSNQSSTFLTETKVVRGHDYPTKELAEIEPLVSGVSLMSQSTLLLKKRKELREINDALEFMKEEYAQRVENCAERQREFERKQEEMREQVSKFEKFIKENDSKRTRAELKAKAEHRSAEQNDVRKKQLVAQLEKDVASRDSLEKRRAQLLKYRTYLESAVEASEQEYEEIADILNRYATLVDANNDLKVQVQSAESQIDRLRQDLRTFKTEMENTILVQNSEIHGHQQQLEKIRGETFQLDLDRGKDDRISNDRSRESGQIVLAIKNLYNRCRMSGKIPPVKESGGDTMAYMTSILKVVAERIVDLDVITTAFDGAGGAADGGGGGVAARVTKPKKKVDEGPIPLCEEQSGRAQVRPSCPTTNTNDTIPSAAMA